MDNDWDIIFDSVWGDYAQMNEEEILKINLCIEKVMKLQKIMKEK